MNVQPKVDSVRSLRLTNYWRSLLAAQYGRIIADTANWFPIQVGYCRTQSKERPRGRWLPARGRRRLVEWCSIAVLPRQTVEFDGVAVVGRRRETLDGVVTRRHQLLCLLLVVNVVDVVRRRFSAAAKSRTRHWTTGCSLLPTQTRECDCKNKVVRCIRDWVANGWDGVKVAVCT